MSGDWLREMMLLAFTARHSVTALGRSSPSSYSLVSGEKRLSRLFSHWPFELDIVEGDLRLHGEFDWAQSGDRFDLRGDLLARLDNLAGVYGELGFIGLSGEVRARITSSSR